MYMHVEEQMHAHMGEHVCRRWGEDGRKNERGGKELWKISNSLIIYLLLGKQDAHVYCMPLHLESKFHVAILTWA